MDSLQELKARNERAATQELAELRADTVKGLKHALSVEGAIGVVALLQDSFTLGAVFDWFADARREQRG